MTWSPPGRVAKPETIILASTSPVQLNHIEGEPAGTGCKCRSRTPLFWIARTSIIARQAELV